jgi:hypothetical protein
LTEELRKIDIAFNNDEMDEQEYNDTRESLMLILEDEFAMVGKYCINVEKNIGLIDGEINRLTEVKKKIEKKKETILSVVKEYMLKTDKKEIDCGIGSFRTRINPPKVSIIDESKIPNMYKVSKITESVDKNKLKKDIMDGKYVDGALVVRDISISLK